MDYREYFKEQMKDFEYEVIDSDMIQTDIRMIKPALLPCPHCGKPAIMSMWCSTDITIKCSDDKDCASGLWSGNRTSVQDFIDRWNRRYTSETVNRQE